MCEEFIALLLQIETINIRSSAWEKGAESIGRAFSPNGDLVNQTNAELRLNWQVIDKTRP
jgi:hypothetical protein